MTPQVPILGYHQVSGSGRSDAPNADPHYTVSADLFARHMSALADRGFAPVPLDALVAGGPRITVPKPIVITFDDGYLSDLRTARTILDSFGWRSEHFVTTNWVGQPGFMTWHDVKELAGLGCGIHSHSKTHPYLDTLPDLAVSEELAGSKAQLESRLGRPVHFFAVPGGHGTSRRIQMLARAAHYRGMCTSIVGRNLPLTRPYSLRRICVTTEMTPQLVGQLADGVGLGRMTLVRNGFRAARLVLGANRYDVIRARLLRQPLPDGRNN